MINSNIYLKYSPALKIGKNDFEALL